MSSDSRSFRILAGASALLIALLPSSQHTVAYWRVAPFTFLSRDNGSLPSPTFLPTIQLTVAGAVGATKGHRSSIRRPRTTTSMAAATLGCHPTEIAAVVANGNPGNDNHRCSGTLCSGPLRRHCRRHRLRGRRTLPLHLRREVAAAGGRNTTVATGVPSQIGKAISGNTRREEGRRRGTAPTTTTTMVPCTTLRRVPSRCPRRRQREHKAAARLAFEIAEKATAAAAAVVTPRVLRTRGGGRAREGGARRKEREMAPVCRRRSPWGR